MIILIALGHVQKPQVGMMESAQPTCRLFFVAKPTMIQFGTQHETNTPIKHTLDAIPNSPLWSLGTGTAQGSRCPVPAQGAGLD